MIGKGSRNGPGDAAATELNELRGEIAALSQRFDQLSQSVEQATARPRGIELLRSLGVKPDRLLDRFFADGPEPDYYAALYGGTEPLRSEPGMIPLTSGLCRQLHFSLDEFRFWMRAMARPPRMHRKEWEWFFIAQALFERGFLEPGKKGLAFAVGQEPLPALFASYGCSITATDQAPEQAQASGWAESGMYSARIETLRDERICPAETFDRNVVYSHADMNDLPPALDGRFDFCWSSCAFEHLGSLDHGLRFVERSLDTLTPGGVAVHTTEFNLSSNDATLESPGCSIYRRRDIEQVMSRLAAAGHEVAPIDWTVGPGLAETVIDLPPYKQSPHLKLEIAGYACTSLGLIIRKR